MFRQTSILSFKRCGYDLSPTVAKEPVLAICKGVPSLPPLIDKKKNTSLWVEFLSSWIFRLSRMLDGESSPKDLSLLCESLNHLEDAILSLVPTLCQCLPVWQTFLHKFWRFPEPSKFHLLTSVTPCWSRHFKQALRVFFLALITSFLSIFLLFWLLP